MSKVYNFLVCLSVLYVIFILFVVCVCLQSFVQHFQEALEQVKAAGIAAAEQAALVTKEYSQKATRIQLDVKLKAPLIIVPQHSKSDNAVVADLGNITVTNEFRALSQKSKDGHPAVLDEMSVELTELKVVR